MAISFLQFATGNNGGGGTASATFTNPIAAGSIIAVVTAADNGATFSFSDGHGDTATDCGLGAINNTPIGTTIRVVAFLSPTTGAQTVTVTTSGTFCEVGIWEIAGLTGAVFDKAVFANNSGTNTPSSGSTGTLSAANEAAIAYGIGNGNYTAAGSGWTADLVPSAFSNVFEHQVVSSNTAIAATAAFTQVGPDSQILCATFMSGGGSSVSVPGVGMTSGAGSFAKAISKPFSGVGVTSAAGSLAEAVAKALSGAGVTGAAGSLAEAVAKALSGAGATSTAGLLATLVAKALSGTSLASAAGSFTDAIVRALTGAALTAGGGTLINGSAVTIDAFSSGATNGGWASGSLSRAADLDGFGSPTNDPPVTVNQGFGFITIGGSATALLVGIMMASQSHGANNPGTLTVTLNPTGTPQVMTQLGTVVDNGSTQGGPTYLFGLVSPASGLGNIQIDWTNHTFIEEFVVYAMSFKGTATSSVSAAFYGFNTANDGGSQSPVNQVSTSASVRSGDMAFALHVNPFAGFNQPANNATGTEMDDDQHVTNNAYGQYFTGSGSTVVARADNIGSGGSTDFWCAAVVAIGTAPTATPLPGSGMTASAGSLAVLVTRALSGAGVTSTAGSLAEAIAKALAGAGVTSGAGSFTDAIVRALSGAGVTSGSGNFVEALAIGLAGAGFTSGAGSFTDAIVRALSGVGFTSGAGTFSISAGNNVTVNLVGAGLTSSAGLFTDAIVTPFAGAGGTIAAGSLALAIAKALAGVGVTSAAGTFSVGAGGSIQLPGIGLVSGAGTFTNAIALALAGAAMSSGAGIMVPLSGLVVPLSGVGLTSAAGTLARAITSVLASAGLTAAPGIITPLSGLVVPLSSAGLTSGAGSLTNAIVRALAGVGLASGVGTLGVTGAIKTAALTGVSATISAGALTVTITGVTLPVPAERTVIVPFELRVIFPIVQPRTL